MQTSEHRLTPSMPADGTEHHDHPARHVSQPLNTKDHANLRACHSLLADYLAPFSKSVCGKVHNISDIAGRAHLFQTGDAGKHLFNAILAQGPHPFDHGLPLKFLGPRPSLDQATQLTTDAHQLVDARAPV